LERERESVWSERECVFGARERKRKRERFERERVFGGRGPIHPRRAPEVLRQVTVRCEVTASGHGKLRGHGARSRYAASSRYRATVPRHDFRSRPNPSCHGTRSRPSQAARWWWWWWWGWWGWCRKGGGGGQSGERAARAGASALAHAQGKRRAVPQSGQTAVKLRSNCGHGAVKLRSNCGQSAIREPRAVKSRSKTTFETAARPRPDRGPTGIPRFGHGAGARAPAAGAPLRGRRRCSHVRGADAGRRRTAGAQMPARARGTQRSSSSGRAARHTATRGRTRRSRAVSSLLAAPRPFTVPALRAPLTVDDEVVEAHGVGALLLRPHPLRQELLPPCLLVHSAAAAISERISGPASPRFRQLASLRTSESASCHHRKSANQQSAITADQIVCSARLLH
jgi:hypothetical protein